MQVIKTIAPHKTGAKKFYKTYGNQLVAVRYRKAPGRRIVTIELIVDEYPAPQDSGGAPIHHAENRHPVGFHIGFDEYELRGKVKAAGARWSKLQRLWYLPRHQVVALGLIDRVIDKAVDRCVDVDLLF